MKKGVGVLRLNASHSNHILASSFDQYQKNAKDLRENNLDNIAPRFGSDLDGTIEENPRPGTAMLRVFRLRPVQRWPEVLDARCPSYFLSGDEKEMKEAIL